MERIKLNCYKTIIGLSIILSMIFAVFNIFDAYALTAKTAFSDPSVTAGNEVSVTMKITSTDENIGSARLVLKYDSSYLEFLRGTSAEGGAGAISVGSLETPSKEWVYNLTFKALKAGDTAITIDSWEIYNADSKMAKLEKQGSSKVTIAAGAGSSTNADLSSLSISPGTLSPEFSAEVKDYTASVGADVNDIAVSAVAGDANAKVSINGNTGLAAGENTVSINVVAEDASTSNTYTVKVTKAGEAETPAQSMEGTPDASTGGKVIINEKEYKIAENFDASILPRGFSASTYTYEGKTYASGYDAGKNTTILYLIAADGSGDFYVYDESIAAWSIYVEINVNSKMITIVPFSNELAVPAELTPSNMVINSKNVQGWINANDTSYEYCVVYAMNENGEKGFYRYDLKEKTIQRYFISDSDKLNELNTAYNKLMKTDRIKTYAIIALSVLALILIIALMSKGDFSKAPDTRYARTGRKRRVRKDTGNSLLEDDDFDADLYSSSSKKGYTSELDIREASLAGELAKEIESINGDDSYDEFEAVDLKLRDGMKKSNKRFNKTVSKREDFIAGRSAVREVSLNRNKVREDEDSFFEEVDL